MLSFFYLVIFGLGVAGFYYLIEWILNCLYSWPFEE